MQQRKNITLSILYKIVVLRVNPLRRIPAAKSVDNARKSMFFSYLESEFDCPQGHEAPAAHMGLGKVLTMCYTESQHRACRLFCPMQ